MKYYIGVDLGGTNIKVGVVNKDYEIIGRSRLKTKLPRPAEEIAEDIVQAVRLACADATITLDEVESIGIGTPGLADRESGVVLYSNNLGFNNTNLRKMIKERIGFEVLVENDANAAAYGEALAGSAKGYDDVVVITLGTGVGSGIIIGGEIYTGFNFSAGEIGHNVIVYDGLKCTCGRKGCFEMYCSATALIRMTKEAMLEDKASRLWEVAQASLDQVNGKTAFEAMRLKDRAGIKVAEDYINYLGCGLTNIINTFQPQILLIGGGVCNEGDYLLIPLREYIKRESYGIDKSNRTKLEIASLGNDAGIIGAAFLCRLGKNQADRTE